jgi:hypothetical protein
LLSFILLFRRKPAKLLRIVIEIVIGPEACSAEVIYMRGIALIDRNVPLDGMT